MKTITDITKRIWPAAAMAAVAAMAAAQVRVALLSDIHVTPGNPCDSALTLAVDEINATDGIDLAIVAGDLTNEGSDEQLRHVKSTLDRITRPLYVIPGNHEDNWSQSATARFAELWGDDRFVTEKDSLIFIGTNCGPFMKMGDGHVKQEDLHWLRTTLSGLMAPGKRVVSINHYPPRVNDLDNYADYIDAIADFPTLIHLNGHYHIYEAYDAGPVQGMMVRALDNRRNFGYTIADFTGDSILIYEKIIGIDSLRRVAAFGYSLPSERQWTRPEPEPVTEPEGLSARIIHADSASVFTRPGFDADHIYFGTSTGLVKAISRTDGREIWRHQAGGAALFSRPVATGGKVYVPTADGVIRVLDPANGRLLRSLEGRGPYVADGVAADGRLYQGGYKTFECWNTEADTLVWRYDSLANYCQGAPALTDDAVVFGAWDTNLRMLSLADGRELWRWNNGKSANMLGPGNVVPVVTDEKVVIVAPDRYMTAIDRRTGATLWRDNSVRYRESLGHSADLTRAYAKTMDGELAVIDLRADTCRTVALTDLGIGYDHAPCIVAETDGIIYAGTRRGLVVAVDAASLSVLGTFRLGSSEINGIDIDPATGDIYVSLIEGRIARIKKNAEM